MRPSIGARPPLAKERETMAATKLSAKEAAKAIGTDARTLRKFIRSDNSGFDACGQGNRYEFNSNEVKALKKAFVAWAGGTTKTEKPTEAKTEKAPAKKKGKKAPVAPMTHEDPDKATGIVLEGTDADGNRVIVADPEDLDIDAELDEPTDEDLEEIEIEDLDD